MNRSTEMYTIQNKLRRIASFASWPEDACSSLVLIIYGLRYTGTLCNVICDCCNKTTSLYCERWSFTTHVQNIPTDLKQRLHKPNCSFLERDAQREVQQVALYSLRSDQPLLEGRENEHHRTRSTRCGRTNEEKFHLYSKIALLMSCPCSACNELYKKDRECLGRQTPLIENDGCLTLSGILHQLKSMSSLDVFYDIHDARTRYGQCFILNEDDSYQCVCCGFVKRDARNTDEDNLSDIHAKTVPTCPLLILTKGEDFIHDKLQEIANEVNELTGTPTLEMQTMLSVSRQLSRNGSGSLDEETANRIIRANVSFFVENGGRYGNSMDILRIVI